MKLFSCVLLALASSIVAETLLSAVPLAFEDPYDQSMPKMNGGGMNGGMMMGGFCPRPTWSDAAKRKFGYLASCGGDNGNNGNNNNNNGNNNNAKPLISDDQLTKIMPGAPKGTIQKYSPYLNQAMQEAGINTPQREAAFLAQLGHESGSFKWMQELASGKEYEGSKQLGNTQPGDGVKYKGRGPIQLTGRANYAAAGKALGLDLINHPELAATPEVGFKTAAWFWNTHHLNTYADQGTQAGFDKITRVINGGTNGAADRNSRYAVAKKQLGIK